MCRSRETENLEYLKNVVIHYMSADAPSQEQLLVPIATVLHFSSDEVSPCNVNSIIAIAVRCSTAHNAPL